MLGHVGSLVRLAVIRFWTCAEKQEPQERLSIGRAQGAAAISVTYREGDASGEVRGVALSQGRVGVVKEALEHDGDGAQDDFRALCNRGRDLVPACARASSSERVKGDLTEQNTPQRQVQESSRILSNWTSMHASCTSRPGLSTLCSLGRACVGTARMALTGPLSVQP